MADEFKKTTKEKREDNVREAGKLGLIPLILNGSRILTSGILSVVTGILAAVLILYSGYVLYDSFYTQRKAGSSNSDLLQYKPAITEQTSASTGGASLASLNEDYRAWLTIDDTNIDYALVQGPDDLYYASHDALRNSSITGAIYLSANNAGGFTDEYNLVYGHHMDANAMFGSLDKFTDESYFDSHREGTLVTTGGVVYNLVTFAVARTDAYEQDVYGNVGDKTAEDVLNYLQTSDDTVIYRDNVATVGSKIIAFSTCAAADTNGRLVVFAVMVPRDLTEVTNDGLTMWIGSCDGLYDAQWHTLDVSVSEPDALVEYSTDGGKTWTTEKPMYHDVGTYTIFVRATLGDKSVSTTALLRITPATVTVSVDPASKLLGAEDPEFTYTVTGLLNGDKVAFTVSRPGAGTDEAIGRYKDAIVVTGEAEQGNYYVVYESADFTIVDPNSVKSEEPPLSRLLSFFRPRGTVGDVWALVNLLCVGMTFYITLPLLRLKSKFGRAKLIAEIELEENEIARLEGREEVSLAEEIKRFKRRFRTGFAGEILVVILAIVVFILTEDMSGRMVLIDEWTPLMAILMIGALAIDMFAMRIRNSDLVKEERMIRRRIRKLKKSITMF